MGEDCEVFAADFLEADDHWNLLGRHVAKRGHFHFPRIAQGQTAQRS
ncbi:MAG: hypothetical protein ACLQM8_20860 [Limisphaerales bacterium]